MCRNRVGNLHGSLYIQDDIGCHHPSKKRNIQGNSACLRLFHGTYDGIGFKLFEFLDIFALIDECFNRIRQRLDVFGRKENHLASDQIVAYLFIFVGNSGEDQLRMVNICLVHVHFTQLFCNHLRQVARAPSLTF